PNVVDASTRLRELQMKYDISKSKAKPIQAKLQTMSASFIALLTGEDEKKNPKTNVDANDTSDTTQPFLSPPDPCPANGPELAPPTNMPIIKEPEEVLPKESPDGQRVVPPLPRPSM